MTNEIDVRTDTSGSGLAHAARGASTKARRRPVAARAGVTHETMANVMSLVPIRGVISTRVLLSLFERPKEAARAYAALRRLRRMGLIEQVEFGTWRRVERADAGEGRPVAGQA
ncbi:hypothetical protein CKO28_21925 [Rhodovibrio sodomensis]|uniref:Uncharacterized protein n=1 Tax=Rhodovibrio sodomensis TaxID=1088 RepID=A0ABS1DKP5_9PROT|nr:hypothetical protein [Rhodovibrio sodomensis]MBK1670682.1 hypothetical protein [Rhodovibrio sodomensis]